MTTSSPVPSYQFLDHGRICEACLGGHFHHAVAAPLQGRIVGVERRTGRRALPAHRHPRLHPGADAHLPEPLPGREDAPRPASTRPGCAISRTSSTPRVWRSRATPGGPALVAGRLSPEKGVDVAIRAIGLAAGGLPRGRRHGTRGGPPSPPRRCGRAGPGPLPRPLVPKSGVHRLMLGASVVALPVALVREPADGGARGAGPRRPGGRQRPGRSARARPARPDRRPGPSGRDPGPWRTALEPFLADPGPRLGDARGAIARVRSDVLARAPPGASRPSSTHEARASLGSGRPHEACPHRLHRPAWHPRHRAAASSTTSRRSARGWPSADMR